MIVLDTHIWVWWVHGAEQLTPAQRDAIAANETDLIGLSLQRLLLSPRNSQANFIVTLLTKSS
jgi:hypothetical protein